MPPPRKKTFVRSRCSVPLSGGCSLAPKARIHAGQSAESRTTRRASVSFVHPPVTRSRSVRNSSSVYASTSRSVGRSCIERRLRVWRLLPPRNSFGAPSMTMTEAPDCLAVSAAHNPALPPPRTATSTAPPGVAGASTGSVNPVLKAVVEPDDRQEPRAAMVKRNRRKVIVKERMLESLARDAPRDETAKVGGHRDAVSRVATRIKRVVHEPGARHLVARERDVSAPRVVDRRRREIRESRDHGALQDRLCPLRALERRLGELGTAPKEHAVVCCQSEIVEEVTRVERHSPLRQESGRKRGRQRGGADDVAADRNQSTLQSRSSLVRVAVGRNQDVPRVKITAPR